MGGSAFVSGSRQTATIALLKPRKAMRKWSTGRISAHPCAFLGTLSLGRVLPPEQPSDDGA